MDCSYLIATLNDGIRIAYAEQPAEGQEKGVIVLVHGFPQTSYQFRKVMKPLASSGYRVIAPDYRGAGLSSRPDTGFTKSVMATDILHLLDHLSIKSKVHVVGHDIGGMIAYAFVAQYSHRTASVTWGECPLPGTTAMHEDRTTHAQQQFHFLFHGVPDLPEALVSGKEEIYLSHFYNKLAYNANAIAPADLNYYVKMYRQPGALRAAFRTYAAFLEDADECAKWVSDGKCKVPALGLSGGMSRHKEAAPQMMAEVHEEGTYKVVDVADSGHWIAEENPDGFVKAVVGFIEHN
ncbi:Alpha/Beta hydrolase protein [Stachybotrys elegans]|uniref:Alpha/Beta hydrolase protein n=1 Tax=Stachybotrys elegans TaxID=80388 RepID=A0A8K0SP66_9HYPO|nr:Alpha/Beta hydrolase protein [Stachybotrys elegans]